jgi:hypothetical protein
MCTFHSGGKKAKRLKLKRMRVIRRLLSKVSHLLAFLLHQLSPTQCLAVVRMSLVTLVAVHSCLRVRVYVILVYLCMCGGLFLAEMCALATAEGDVLHLLDTACVPKRTVEVNVTTKFDQRLYGRAYMRGFFGQLKVCVCVVRW